MVVGSFMMTNHNKKFSFSMCWTFFQHTDKTHQMTIIELNGPTNIEPQLPKNAPKWFSMEAPPSHHESMELTTAVLSPPIIDHRSALIVNPVEETDNRTTNSSRNVYYKNLNIMFCITWFCITCFALILLIVCLLFIYGLIYFSQ